MEIWLDTINFALVKKAVDFGLLKGVTTNPQILAQSEDIESTLTNLLEMQEGPITCQVTVSDAEGIILQGLAYEKISDRILVKVPVTQEGLKAIHNLSERKIDVMATVIVDSRQYLLAALAGAHYAAPYYASIVALGKNADHELEKMIKCKQHYQLKTKILVASLQDLGQLERCLDLGVDAVTLKDELFLKFIEDHPHTLERTFKFQETWNHRKSR